MTNCCASSRLTSKACADDLIAHHELGMEFATLRERRRKTAPRSEKLPAPSKRRGKS